MFLTRISVAHPVFATMMMAALLVIGWFSLGRLGIDEFPDVDFPVVVVTTEYKGAAPETVETEVTRPIEDSVNTIGGIDTITSNSYEGRSVVIVQFELSVDTRQAAEEVRDRVARAKAGFNDDIDEPLITRFDPDESPILSLAVSSDTQDLTQLTTVAQDDIADRLGLISGVGQTTIVGGSERQIEIRVDAARLQALSIGIDAVIQAVRRENQDLPAGSIRNAIHDNTVQVEGRMHAPEDFRRIIVASRGGFPVYLSEVAEVADTGKEQTSLAIYDGHPALSIDVVRTQGANIVEVAKSVRAELAKLEPELAAKGISVQVIRDNSASISASLDDVERTLVEGAALTVAIVFLFLNSWRSTVITGLTLPIAVIGTFAVVYFLGFTLNTLTMMALSLAIGILIDDAIVVRENITRHLHMGKSHRQAALDGTNEIGLAVFATTLSIVAVFLPVAFMGGIIGRFFLQFGITVSVAVLLSLFVSFTLDPMLSSVWYDPHAERGAKRGPLGRLVARFDAGFDRLAEGYRHVVTWSLRHRLSTLLAALAIFVGSLFLLPVIGAEFVPQGDTGQFDVHVTAAEGSSLQYTAAKLAQVEAALRSFPEVAHTYGAVNASGARGKNEAVVLVELTPHDTGRRTPDMLAPLLRARLAEIAGLKTSVEQPGIGGNGKPVQVSVLGDDLTLLARVSAQLEAALKAIPGAVDVESSIDERTPILSVRLRDEAASDLGIGLQQVGDTLRPLIEGDEISTWDAPDGESYDVSVRLPELQRGVAADLQQLTIATGRNDSDGNPVTVRLDQVAEVVPAFAPSRIDRKDLSRQVLVDANVSGTALGEVTAALQTRIDAMQLPPGVRVVFGGQADDMAESFGYAMAALGLAVTFIYLILASQFGSFLQPVAIMTTLPLSLIGVLLGLLVAGSTLNMFSVIGFIMLMGLVTKNAILMVDFSNRERRRGMDLHAALAEAGAVRLRPIVMTTLAMIFGMMPLALGLGEGGGQRAPMAHAVIGGLISSTLLTLVFVPVILSYLDALSRRLKRWLPAAPVDGATAAEAD